MVENATACVLCMPGSHAESETGANFGPGGFIYLLTRELLQEAG